jgi:hypothetical protein
MIPKSLPWAFDPGSTSVFGKSRPSGLTRGIMLQALERETKSGFHFF